MKPTLEFFETLGQYIYNYVNEFGEVIYIGKGVGDRCLSHLKSKGYKLDRCNIVARNLEKFNDKPSLLLESFLIERLNPADNSVAGHYKECFNVASLSSMFSEYKTLQYDPFDKFPEWFIKNYDTFKGRLRELRISTTSFYLCSNANNGIYMYFYVPNKEGATEEPIKVQFELASYFKGDKLQEMHDKMNEWLAENGLEPDFSENTDKKILTNASNIEQTIFLFKEFWS